MKIFYSTQFFHEYRQLPIEVKKKVEKKENIFRQNPFDKRLKTHKLKGRLADFWAFSVDFHYRVIFNFQNEKDVRFYAIGDHSFYKKI
jgi:mRNA-degrading endonuclease YafQ of YafQ-DinJ toxin-antitoxin module